MSKECSHGKSWEEQCTDCEAISEDESLQFLSGLCRRAAAFYEKNPGLIQAATIVDLYRAIARLADSVLVAPQPPKDET